MRGFVHAVVSGATLGLGGCFGGLPSPCHDQMIERHGCCPICDAACRAAVDAACADDEHEPEEQPAQPEEPLEPVETETGGID